MKQKKPTRTIALVMLLLAGCFTAYAMGHPEGFFPWGETITHWIYRLYLIVTVILFFI